MTPRRRRRLRWVVPAAALAATAAISTIPKMIPASADPVPVLPPLTAAQLMDRVRTSDVTTLSGDIAFTARLGLPDLSSFGVGGGTFLDLLSGTHTAHVWVDGPERVRLAIDSPQAEQDWIRNGADVWAWDSSSMGVTHVSVPEGADHERVPSTVPAVDPATAALQLLDAVDPTTEVSVRTPGYVAGRPVYELVVAPRSATSTVADGEIAVDAATGVPLAVRVHAKDTTAAVIDIEFTSISFDTPPASTFTFTPPPGSTVKEAASVTELLPLGSFGHHGERAARRAKAAVTDQGGTDQAVTVAATGQLPRVDRTGPRSDAKVVGEAWDSVAIVSGVNLGRQFQTLFSNSPAVTVGGTTGHLVSTRLVNVLVLDDGRIAIGAVTPEALEAAVAGA